LNNHRNNGQKMRYAKPGIPDPRPSMSFVCEDKRKANYNKSDEKRVQQ
jgi:hypothetical protein